MLVASHFDYTIMCDWLAVGLLVVLDVVLGVGHHVVLLDAFNHLTKGDKGQSSIKSGLHFFHLQIRDVFWLEPLGNGIKCWEQNTSRIDVVPF